MQPKKIQQGVPVSKSIEGETAIYRNPKYKSELLSTINPGIETVQDVIRQGQNKWKNSPVLGTKKANNRSQEFKTWAECYNIALWIGSGIIHEGLIKPVKEFKAYETKFLGIYSKNREEWLLCDWACLLFGFISVPFYDSLGIGAIKYIFEQTNLQTIACSKECLEKIVKENGLGNIKNIICQDPIESSLEKELQAKNVRFYFIHDLIKIGMDHPIESINNKLTKADIFTLVQTSGTCGFPKGAIISHSNMTAGIGIQHCFNQNATPEDRYLSYLPLAHLQERLMIQIGLHYGIKIGFYSGNIQKIAEDLQDLKPTIFLGVPRIFNRMQDTLTNTFKKLSCLKRFLVEKALSSKLNRLKTQGKLTHYLWDKLIFNSIKQNFGGSIRIFFSSSAPLSQEIKDFLRVIFSCNFVEGQGMTESSGGALGTIFGDMESGYAGGPLPINEVKLIDVPEMSFFTNNKDKLGNVLPQGEILIKGQGNFQGYWKDEEKTKEILDSEGWLHTGDIGELNIERGCFRIIDRKKNIFKLSQGEQIAPEKLEVIQQRGRAIEEAFIYGDSFQNFLVGIFVPKKPFILEKAQEFGLESQDYETLLENEKIKNSLKTEIDVMGNKENLMGYEKVAKFKLVSESFQASGIVTTTFKLKRHEAKLHFKKIIDQLYCQGLTEEMKK